MLPQSGRARIIQKSEDLVVLARSPVRRIMFLILFLFLGVTMLFAVDPETDLSGAELLRTIGYALVLLALLGASGWSQITSFDRNENSVERVTLLFGLTLKRDLLTPLDRIEAVVMQKAVLLHDSRGMRSGVFGNLFEPRSEVQRLYLETDEKRIRIDDGDEEKLLEDAGTFFSQFLDVKFFKEEIGG